MYNPNINDPRVKARIEKALGWAKSTLGTQPRPVPQSTITKQLGQGQTDLAKWLRKRLLVTADNHYNMETGKCKKYTLNVEGSDEIQSLLGLSKKQVTEDWMKTEYKEVLETKEFTYTDKSNRLWNPLQNVKSEIRDKVLAENGLKHNYDIQCAAPSLILQYAKKCGLKKQCPTIEEYIRNRNKIRNKLSNETGIPVGLIKKCINGMFGGAQIGLNPRSRLYAEVNNPQAMIALKNSATIVKMKKELGYCWNAIKPHISYTKAFNGEVKSAVYRSLEREVIEQVIKYLDNEQCRYLLIHDGWISDKEIDLYLLQNFIVQSNDYSVVIDYECIDV